MNSSAGFQHVDLTKVVIINRTSRWKGNLKRIDETTPSISSHCDKEKQRREQ